MATGAQTKPQKDTVLVQGSMYLKSFSVVYTLTPLGETAKRYYPVAAAGEALTLRNFLGQSFDTVVFPKSKA